MALFTISKGMSLPATFFRKTVLAFSKRVVAEMVGAGLGCDLSAGVCCAETAKQQRIGSKTRKHMRQIIGKGTMSIFDFVISRFGDCVIFNHQNHEFTASSIIGKGWPRRVSPVIAVCSIRWKFLSSNNSAPCRAS
jgi:hypothetical protein